MGTSPDRFSYRNAVTKYLYSEPCDVAYSARVAYSTAVSVTRTHIAHTHTQIYIYIYIYIHTGVCGEKT